MQALRSSVTKLKVACSAETIRNKFKHIKVITALETPMHEEALSKAIMAIGEKEMKIAQGGIRNVLQSKLPPQEQKR